MNDDGYTMRGLAWKLLPWLADVVCGLLVAWAVQINGEIKSIRHDISALREWKAETAGNRYTSKDHVAYADENARAMQQVWAKISDLQQEWLRDVGEIKVSIARLDAKIGMLTSDKGVAHGGEK